MFERFTEQARRVLVLAAREARLAGHDSLDSGDLLVALAEEEAGIASLALRGAGADPGRLSAANRARRAEPALEAADPGDDAMAIDAKVALQAAAEQAIADEQADVSTGHLLLGILDQSDCPALRMLQHEGIDASAARDAILLLGKDGHRDGDPVHSANRRSPSKVLPVLFGGWDAPAAITDALAEADASGDAGRQWALADWLVRMCTPTWLRAAGLDEVADELAALQPITSPAHAEPAGDAIERAAAALADVVPGPVPATVRPAMSDALAQARTASGERGVEAAVTVDVSDAVTGAAAEGVTRAMAELVLRRGDDHSARLWGRSFTAARKAAESEGRLGAGRRPGGQRSQGSSGARVAMRAVRMAAGPAALPLTLLEAGVRSARARRARDRIESTAARSALVACCRQLVDDAGWIVAGGRSSGNDVDTATAPLAGELRSRLSALLGGDVLF